MKFTVEQISAMADTLNAILVGSGREFHYPLLIKVLEKMDKFPFTEENYTEAYIRIIMESVDNYFIENS